jgi:hypothetical protein
VPGTTSPLAVPPEVERYLARLAAACADALGADLVGLWTGGSVAHGDFHVGSSDLDVLGVVRSPVEDGPAADLAARTDHARIPVPALGLELTFWTEASARDASGPTDVEWASSTGATWPSVLERRGRAAEVPIERAICRQHGRALIGPPASDVFAPVPPDVLRRAVLAAVEWQRGQVLDAFHDPGGRNSVLNACRALRFAETGVLGSKTDGGRWALSREPENALVRTTLAVRSGRDAAPPDAEAIERFLADALRRLGSPA